jgi:RNA polymerase sigma factor (sigma-70 family)
MVRSVEDRALVAAIREGNSVGLAGTYDTYGDALFSFCLSMLHDRSSAEDAVQDTFVVLVHRVGQLRDPSKLRPWLYAVARSQCLRQIRSARRVVPLEAWDETMSADTPDFDAAPHSAQLQALVWQAMGGLNSGERAALELSLRHGLDGDDLAAALDVTRSNANKLLERGRAELERSLAALLVARDPSRCSELAEIVADWDGVMTPLMRKRIARHIDRCPECGEQKKRRVSAAALFSVIPLLAASAQLRSRVVGGFRLVSDDSAMGARDRAAVESIAGYDAAGFPSTRPRRRRVRGAAAAAVVAALLAGGVVLHSSASPDSRPAAALATSSTSSAAITTTAAPVGTPTSTHAHAVRSVTHSPARHSTSAARPSPSATSIAAVSSAASVPPTPTPHPHTTTLHSPVPHPTRPTTVPPSRPRTPTTPAPDTSPTTPKQATVTATVNPTKYSAASGGSGVLTLSVTGAPVHWSASAPDGVTFSPASGAIPAGATGHTKVIVPAAASGTVATITITWATGSTTTTITWS